MIVSRDASSKFHRTSFQNERFLREGCFPVDPPHPARRNRVIEKIIKKQAQKQTTGKQAGKPIASNELHVHTRAIKLYSINNFAKNWRKSKVFIFITIPAE